MNPQSGPALNPQQAFGSGGLTADHYGTNAGALFGPPTPLNFNPSGSNPGLTINSQPPSVLGASTQAPQPSGGGGGNPVGYAPSFNGQTVSKNGQTYQSNNGQWNQLLNQLGSSAGQVSHIMALEI